MATKLKNYFPIIREREEVLAEILKNGTLHRRFGSWPKEKREEFLDLCTGARGLKLLYDGFFKEVMNPEYVPGRLSDFLSCTLGQKVRVIRAIPTSRHGYRGGAWGRQHSKCGDAENRVSLPGTAKRLLLGGPFASPVQAASGKQGEFPLPGYPERLYHSAL